MSCKNQKIFLSNLIYKIVIFLFSEYIICLLSSLKSILSISLLSVQIKINRYFKYIFENEMLFENILYVFSQ